LQVDRLVIKGIVERTRVRRNRRWSRRGSWYHSKRNQKSAIRSQKI